VCILVQLLSTCSVHVISLTTMAIAVDRCLRLSVTRKQLRGGWATVINLIIWVVAILLCIPIALHLQLNDRGQCTQIWLADEETARCAYIVFLITVQYVIPSTVITACYIRVSRYAKFRKQSVIRQRKRSQHDREAGMLTMSVLIIICFVLAFMPSTVLHFITEYVDVDVVFTSTVCLVFILTVVAHTASSLSTIANPILYGCLNTTFRRCMKQSVILSQLTISMRLRLPSGHTPQVRPHAYVSALRSKPVCDSSQSHSNPPS
jgi:hypothetical protein